MFLQPVKPLEQLGQPLKDRHGAKPDAVVEPRRPGDHFARRHIVGDGRLRGQDSPIPDGAVPGDRRLAGQYHVAANHRRTCHTNLPAEQSILADTRTVTYLHEVIDLCAVANLSCANGCAVNTRVGLHIDAAAHTHWSGLKDLLPLA